MIANWYSEGANWRLAGPSDTASKRLRLSDQEELSSEAAPEAREPEGPKQSLTDISVDFGHGTNTLAPKCVF